MKCTVQPFDVGALVISPEQSAPRTSGDHVSSIINHILTTMGQRDNDFTEAQLNQFATLGRLWEAQLAAALFPEPRYVRPGECECEGIIGSPDCVDTHEWAVTEFKVTWVSSNREIDSPKLKHYLWQVKAYCHILGMLRARVIVLHVCGEWHPPVPMAKDYHLLFTRQELTENWMMLRNNRVTV